MQTSITDKGNKIQKGCMVCSKAYTAILQENQDSKSRLLLDVVTAL